MRIFFLLLLNIFFLSACSVNFCRLKKDRQPLPMLIRSVLNVIDNKSEFNAYQRYIYKVRNEAVHYMSIKNYALNEVDKFAIIDEYDPLASHRVVGEIYLFNGINYQYEKPQKNLPVRYTTEKISGRNDIIEFLENDDLDGLLRYAKIHSKGISEGALLFVSLYSQNSYRSVLINQFSIN